MPNPPSWMLPDAPRDSQYPFTGGFTPEWSAWITASYQEGCRDTTECPHLGADYYRIMAAMRGRCQGEG